MSISRDDVVKVAHLARIGIDEQDIPVITDRLNRILALVDTMQQQDTSNIEPLGNPHDASARLRSDEVTAGNEREQLMANAPLAENGLFLVPRVIE
ncbi:MAG TPA: Asp-tRNA(Asn)/Glu-tRNA(Gln) amidotransferase subunit GatC [Pseudomonadales bacterium]